MEEINETKVFYIMQLVAIKYKTFICLRVSCCDA
jgi:hypothetical protein